MHSGRGNLNQYAVRVINALETDAVESVCCPVLLTLSTIIFERHNA